MSDDDGSSSEDIDYKPTTKEIKEAEAEEKRLKRQKTGHQAADTIAEVKSSAKVDGIWQQLSGAGGSKPAPRRVDLAALSRPAKAGTAPAADREWMRQLGIPLKAAGAVGGVQKKPAMPLPAKSSLLSSTAAATVRPMKETKSLDLGAAAKALAAAKAAMSSTSAQHAGQVSITETRKFSGKEVQVSRMASANEAAEVKRREEERKNTAGLDAVLASLQGPKKVTVLDKSRDDWGTFKSADASVAEELEAHKKSGSKYLDKVDFLKRAELRQYEAERDERLGGDMRSRGRI